MHMLPGEKIPVSLLRETESHEGPVTHHGVIVEPNGAFWTLSVKLGQAYRATLMSKQIQLVISLSQKDFVIALQPGHRALR